MDDYWSLRSGLGYYARALAWALEMRPPAKSILDIGAGPTLLLNSCEQIETRSVLDIRAYPIWRELHPAIRRIVGGFPDVPVEPHEIVLCLQVLEHVPQKQRERFVQSVFAKATRAVILSIPYRWRSGNEHDGLDERALQLWTGREFDQLVVMDHRAVAFYGIPTPPEKMRCQRRNKMGVLKGIVFCRKEKDYQVEGTFCKEPDTTPVFLDMKDAYSTWDNKKYERLRVPTVNVVQVSTWRKETPVPVVATEAKKPDKPA